MTALEPEHAARFLSNAETLRPRPDHALFAFLLGTGARLGSTLAFEVRGVDLAAGADALRELEG